MKLSIYIGAAVLLLVTGFLVGWMECNWHRDSIDLTALKKQDAAQATAAQKMADDADLLQRKIVAINGKTNSDQTSVLNAIQEQHDALSKLAAKLPAVDVGNCSFTPALDGLYQSAYQAVAAPAPAGSAGR